MAKIEMTITLPNPVEIFFGAPIPQEDAILREDDTPVLRENGTPYIRET